MKKTTIIISLLVISVSAWWGIKHFTKSKTPESDVVWVQASKVRQQSLNQETNMVGSLSARRQIEITPEFAGHVEKILFTDGAFVTQGTPLIQLDDSVFKTKYESAKAKLTYSEHNFQRMSLLGKKGVVAKQTIDQAEADLKEKRAESQENGVILEKMRLVAPFDGIVGKCKVNLGDYVTIGQSLVTITDVKHLRIDYNVPEKYLSQIKLGQQVKVTTSAYPDKIFHGTVAFISPTINTDNRSISLYADLSNDNNLLKPGMFVNVTQSLDQLQQAVMIPARSLVPILDGEQVYKVIDGKAYASQVTVGKRNADQVQIIQGLTSGDVVITDGQFKLKNGTAVKIKL